MLKYFRVIGLNLFKILWSYLTWILRYSKNPTKYPLEVRYKKVRKLCKSVLKGFNLLPIIKGKEEYLKANKSGRNILYVCNHISFIDPLFFIVNSDKPISFVAKKEVKKMILVGRIVTILEGEFIDREDLKQELRCFMRIQERMKNHQMDYIIFPEGTRNKTHLDSIAEFHPGAFRPAFKTDSEILICSISGSERLLSLKYKEKINSVSAEFVKCISPEEYKLKNTNEIALLAHDLCQDSYTKIKEENNYLITKFNR